MPVVILATTSAATMAVAIAYLSLGRSFLRRQTSTENRPASRAFAIWWYATGTNIALASVIYLAASLERTSLEIQFTYTILQRPLLAAASAALLFYILHVLTGRDLRYVLATTYAAFGLANLYLVIASRPQAVVVTQYRTSLQSAVPEPAWGSLLNMVMILIPVGVGLLAFAFLGIRRRDLPSRQRVRLVTVGLSLLVWWVVAVIAGRQELLGNEAFQFVNRVVGLAVAGAVFVVYRQPDHAPPPKEAPRHAPA